MNPDAQVFRDYCKRCNRVEQQTEREGMNQMVQRWKMSPNQSMVTEPDGGYVEYEDHIAAIEEKDREIERLQTNIDVMKRALRWKEDGDAIPVAPAQTPETDPDP